jgi:hypothetical protein
VQAAVYRFQTEGTPTSFGGAQMLAARRERPARDAAQSRPELHLPSGAAQPRIVSVARIRLDSRKSVRPFKGIICADISEFARTPSALRHSVFGPRYFLTGPISRARDGGPVHVGCGSTFSRGARSALCSTPRRLRLAFVGQAVTNRMARQSPQRSTLARVAGAGGCGGSPTGDWRGPKPIRGHQGDARLHLFAGAR